MVIDAHTHVGEARSVASLSAGDEERLLVDPADPTVDYAKRTAVMDDDGVDEAVVLPSFTYDTSQGIESTRRYNDSMHRIAREHDRFACGIATVEPSHGEAALGELDRVADLGFPGVAWHHNPQGIALDTPASLRCIRRAEDLGLTPIVHCFTDWNYEELDRLDRIASRTGEPLLVLDATSTMDNVKRVIRLGHRHEHLHFDTALMFSIGRVVERLVDELGPERLVYGSDLYTDPLMYRRSPDLFQVRTAEIDEGSRDLILEGNIRRLLDL